MFRGQSRHTIDQKGRVSLPSRFRDALEKANETNLIITPDPFEPCLHLYGLTEWEKVEQKIDEMPRMSPKFVALRRRYISPAMDISLDKAGRILIAPELRQRAKLEKEVLWAGMRSKAELWSVPLWEEAMAMTEEEFADFRDTVQELI